VSVVVCYDEIASVKRLLGSKQHVQINAIIRFVTVLITLYFYKSNNPHILEIEHISSYS